FKGLYRWGDARLAPSGVAHYCKGLPPMQSWVGSRVEANERELGAAEPFSAGVDASGFGRGDCVQLQVDDSLGDFFIPPPELDGWLLDPGPVSLGREERSQNLVQSIECEGERLSRACVSVVPAGLRIELGAGGFLIQVRSRTDSEGAQAFWRLLSAESPRVQHMGPLLPDTSYRVTIARLSGEPEDSAVLRIKSGPAASRLVLTELQADPFGSEPGNEWVEVFNAGSATASLAGLSIW